MVSRVQYRPFEDGDFEAVAEIMRGEWHHRTANDEFSRLEAQYDLAYSLSISSFSQVVLVDGVVRGIVLARVDAKPCRHADHWHERERTLFAQMKHRDEDAADNLSAFTRAEIRVNNALLKESGIEPAAQITLLAVSDQARGLGIGSVLLDAALSYCSTNGAERAYLFTDTCCSWQFYERRGLKRLAMHRANREERKILPREMYLYGLDLSD